MSGQFSISVRESDEGKRLDFRQDEDLVSGGFIGNEARLYFTTVGDYFGVATPARNKLDKLVGEPLGRDDKIAFIGHIKVMNKNDKRRVREAFLEAMMNEARIEGSKILGHALDFDYLDDKEKDLILFLLDNGFVRFVRNLYIKVLNRTSATNPFLAQPTAHRGLVMAGVLTHPGFHTGSSLSICQPYAQAKVLDYLPDTWGKELQRHVMRDYPVIVELDMHGLPFEIDYDAANWFNDAVQAAISESEDYDDLYSYLDFAATEEEMPETMIEALFYLSGAKPDRAVYNLRDWLQNQKDPYEAFARVKKDGIPDDLLAQVSGQFRYTQDVPTGRIVAVNYIRPVFDYLFPHYDDPEWHFDKVIERIESLGYDTVTLENVYDGSEVLTVAHRIGMTKLWREADQRIEFHGTSLSNLLAAAPELEGLLPTPPPPFRLPPYDEIAEADPEIDWFSAIANRRLPRRSENA